jgi:membrane associated rhomboid family serine protease
MFFNYSKDKIIKKVLGHVNFLPVILNSSGTSVGLTYSLQTPSLSIILSHWYSGYITEEQVCYKGICTKGNAEHKK